MRFDRCQSLKSVFKDWVFVSRRGEKDQIWHQINQRCKADGHWEEVEVTMEIQLSWKNTLVRNRGQVNISARPWQKPNHNEERRE